MKTVVSGRSSSITDLEKDSRSCTGIVESSETMHVSRGRKQFQTKNTYCSLFLITIPFRIRYSWEVDKLLITGKVNSFPIVRACFYCNPLNTATWEPSIVTAASWKILSFVNIRKIFFNNIVLNMMWKHAHKLLYNFNNDICSNFSIL